MNSGEKGQNPTETEPRKKGRKGTTPRREGGRNQMKRAQKPKRRGAGTRQFKSWDQMQREETWKNERKESLCEVGSSALHQF